MIRPDCAFKPFGFRPAYQVGRDAAFFDERALT